MSKKILATIFTTALFLGIATRVQARISYGDGSYTNLCGGGTNAETYTCSEGCNPNLGRCESDNDSVVKWVCNGRLNQCGENESDWAKLQDLSQIGCDKTVQISLFDKKCRMGDGSWDSSCVLSGYMVWYSGSCNGLSPTLGYSATPSATMAAGLNPTARPTSKPTAKPTAKPGVSPTLIATPGNATSGGVKTTPETGPELIWALILMFAMAGSGWWLIKVSKKVI